jgi:LeuA-like protein with dimerisation domain
MTAARATPPEATLQLARWTVTSGSNARSRGAVVITADEHEWRASAGGNGAIEALYQAVDKALNEVLNGHPRLLAYDIHALGEGTDTIGAVSVRIAPPDITGERGTGEYGGEARGANIIAASIEAYIMALNKMLDEAHWSGATDAATSRRRVPVSAGKARAQRADIDEDEGQPDTVAWFER